MDLGLTGKSALVTGGGTGIGRSIAMALAREGVDRVAIAGLELPRETTHNLRGLGAEVVELEVDVSEEDQVVAMVEHSLGEFGDLDIFVNNAGNHWDDPITRISTKDWHKTIDTNLSACMWACREVAKHMIPRKSGSIMVTVSTIQYMPEYGTTSYKVSKNGLSAYAENLALELAPHRIRVNTLSPGIIRTKFARNLDEILSDCVRGKKLLSSIPLGRLGQADDLGAIAAVILSDSVSGYVTGADIVVDGGFKMRPLVLVTQDEIDEMNSPQ